MHKKLILSAIVLFVVGIVMIIKALFMVGFDEKALSSVVYVTNQYEVKESFQNITINGDSETITFVRSEDGICKVVCVEDQEESHDIRVREDTLTIEKKKTKRWHFTLFAESPKITVYLPKEAYGKLSVYADSGIVALPGDFFFEGVKIELDSGMIDLASSARGDILLETDSGKIRLHDVSAANLSLTTESGFVEVTDITCEGSLKTNTEHGVTEITNAKVTDFSSMGDSGRLLLQNVIAAGTFQIERDSGSVSFDECDAKEIRVETDSGSVKGSFLTDKVFHVKTDSGRVVVPETESGGKCEITTHSGSITISIS